MTERLLAYVPDLMDRSKVSSAAGTRVTFVPSPTALVAAVQEAASWEVPDLVVVDLSRPGVIEVLPELAGLRVIGFGSHVDRELLERARAAGCPEVMARSAFFARVVELLA